MKLAMMMCPNCGGKKLEKREGGAYCPYCGMEFVAEYLDEQEALLEALGTVKQEALANARRMLYDAAHAENLSSEQILKGAREVRKYISDDFLANFYEAACNDDARIVNKFLDGVDVSKHGKMFLAEVCGFMLSSLTKRNVVAFKSFLERAHLAGVFMGGEYTAYLTRTEEEAKKLDDGVYDVNLPRDVFIAYSSMDMAEVNELTDYLEEEKLRCFVALRNLRHGKGAAENYQRLLETAMRNCESFLFVSTEHSRDLDCDALAVELPYLREHRADIYRVEYRPASDSGRTNEGAKILLEEFFANLEYARTREDVLKRLIRHKYGLDKAVPAPAPAPQPKPAPAPASTPAPAPKPAQPQLSAEAFCAMGDKYYNAEEYDKAVEYYRKAAEQGNAEAQRMLGDCYYYGDGVPLSYEKAVEWYTKAAEQGDVYAQRRLGDCYYYGKDVLQSYEKAVEWYTKAAEQGNAEAQNDLGYCYDAGKGVPQSYEKAVEWYTKAAEQGHAWAQNNLGNCYKDGQGVPQDYKKAAEWFRKAAEQGNAEAQCSFGVCYDFGKGMPQSYEQAVEWYRKAAEQGHVRAQYNLGVCYEKGQGVPQSWKKAVEWYTKAAKQGHAWAQYNLGVCYENGHGVPQSWGKAVEWYHKAAEQGDAEAQYKLGKCYEKGQGVPQSIEKAVEWYKKAAAQGYEPAKLALNNLGY